MRRGCHERHSGRGWSSAEVPSAHSGPWDGPSFSAGERSPCRVPRPSIPSHPSQRMLCPWPRRLSGLPLTTLGASSVKWVDARAVGAHGRPAVLQKGGLASGWSPTLSWAGLQRLLINP